mgnify:CR=1 FL=1
MRNGLPTFSIYLLSFLVPLSADTSVMFVDEIYGSQRTEGIQYGTGSTGNPASGSIDLYLDIYEPTGTNLPEKRPVMVFIHGGGFSFGDKGTIAISNFCESFTKRGYVCASIQYRLVGDDPTYEAGPAPNLSVLYRSMNAASQDAAKAIRWLRQNAATYHIDTMRIGIGGTSAGAITSLYTASQEAGTIGPDAETGVVIDLWGAMYGAESLVDAGDPAIFIAHGTDDPTVAYSETENLVAHLDSINHPYQLYPITGAGHASWSRFNNDVVNGKTIFQHSVEFAFNHLKLINLHPAGQPQNNQLTLSTAPITNQLSLTFPSYRGFQYLIQSSENLDNWTTENPTSPFLGTDTPLTFTAPMSTTKQFYRVEILPNF